MTPFALACGLAGFDVFSSAAEIKAKKGQCAGLKPGLFS